LILDSDAEAAQVMAQKLNETAPVEVHVAESSFEAGISTERFNPHVMIINLHAQGVNVSRICQVMKSQEEFEAVKMVALAGHLSESEWSALLQKGFDDYISDSGDIAMISQKIQDAVAIIYQ
jgi:DNA-binding response OmpR family regulator